MMMMSLDNPAPPNPAPKRRPVPPPPPGDPDLSLPPRVCCLCGKIVAAERVQFSSGQPHCPECYAGMPGQGGAKIVIKPERSSRHDPISKSVSPTAGQIAMGQRSLAADSADSPDLGDSGFNLSDSARAMLSASLEQPEPISPLIDPRSLVKRRISWPLAAFWITGPTVILILGVTVMLAVRAKMDEERERDKVVQTLTTQPAADALLAFEEQLNGLLADARRLESEGSTRLAVIKYKTLNEMLWGPEAEGAKFAALRREVGEKVLALDLKRSAEDALAAAARAYRGIYGTASRSSDDAAGGGPATRPEVAAALAEGSELPEDATTGGEPAVAFNVPRAAAAVPAPVPGPASVPAQNPDRAEAQAPVPAPVELAQPPISPVPPPKPVLTPAFVPVSAWAPAHHADDHIERGAAYLREGDLAAADSAFKQAIELDNKFWRGYHGRGLVAFLQKRRPEGARWMETALRFSPKGYPPPRSLTYNIAAAHLQQNAMRSARFVIDYLSNPRLKGVDEEMANALGAALNMADNYARNHSFFAEARDFYLDYDKRLSEVRNDGMYRWGTQWLPTGEAFDRWNRYRQAAQAVALERQNVAAASRNRQRVYSRAAYMRIEVIRSYRKEDWDGMHKIYRQALDAEIQARGRLHAAEYALDQTPQPNLLTELTPILDP